MEERKTETGRSLKIRRQFKAPREKVFRAWTDPKEISKWFAPSDSYETKVTALELKVGGKYRIEMISENRVTNIKAPVPSNINANCFLVCVSDDFLRC